MALPPPASKGRTPFGFAAHLRAWRQRQRLSQMHLALDAGVSQRHLSHLESGRSQPSRSMVLLLGQALRASLREQNDALQAAGFAPAFRSRELECPDMAPVLEAVEHLLRHHEPYPAVAVDREWNACRMNLAFERVIQSLDADAWGQVGAGSRNLMRLFFHPKGIRPWVANWDEVAPLLWLRACREAEADATGRVQATVDELREGLSVERWAADPQGRLLPVLPIVLAKEGTTLSLFSTIATFGTALDVTTDELRIECFFPADETSKEVLRALAHAARP